jgi:hypothetical protein
VVVARSQRWSPFFVSRSTGSRIIVTTLLTVYQIYYILAGIAGLLLFYFVARMSLQRLMDYFVSFDRAAGLRYLLLHGLLLVVCCAEVQFCFARAATLIRIAAG